jgi:hypothetical protein
MKNMFDPATAQEIKARLAALQPTSQRQWGKMSPAQAMAHCVISMRWALGDLVPDPSFIGLRLIGRIIKPMVLKENDPLRRNSPTAKSLIVSDEKDLAQERAHLSSLIDRFAAGGPAQCTGHPHSFFGRMRPNEWAILMYKHLDHHLRQFGA